VIFSIKSRLMASHLAVALVAAVATSVYLYVSFGRLQAESMEHSLLAGAYALADALETDFGTPHGIVQAQHALRKLANEDSSDYMILDHRGRVVATTASATDAHGLAGIQEALRGRSYTRVRRGADAEAEHIVAAVPIEDDGKAIGVVRVWITESDYTASMLPIKRVTALALLGVVVLSIAVSLALAQALTIPITKMRRLSRRIAKGDFSIRVKAAPADELGELAADLNTMAAKLQELESVRREFVGNVSHELRSPVSNIRITSEVLERRAERLGDDSAKLFETITSETQRLESMIDELLELSAFESGSLRLQEETLELGPLLEEVVEAVSARARQKGVRLGLLVEPGTQIKADRVRLARAVSNLLDNAVKFTPAEGQVVVSARRTDQEMLIEVTDSGEGISRDDLPRVFERFFRADRARTRNGGAGIGLAIVKQIAESHGGSAEAYSEEGRGSTFRLRLPGR
jgi:signal transduction histidine kinase